MYSCADFIAYSSESVVMNFRIFLETFVIGSVRLFFSSLYTYYSGRRIVQIVLVLGDKCRFCILARLISKAFPGQI